MPLIFQMELVRLKYQSFGLLLFWMNSLLKEILSESKDCLLGFCVIVTQ